MQLIQHNKGGSYFHHRNCTIYLLYGHYSPEVGIHHLAYEDGYTMNRVGIYIFKGTLIFKKTDKVMFEDRLCDELYILEEDGTKITFTDKEYYKITKWKSYYFQTPYETIEEFHNDKEAQQAILNAIDKFLDKTVTYYGTILTPLTKFDNMPCLWVNVDLQGRWLPHMEFVGGYCNEYCVFLSSLSDEDWKHVTRWNEEPITKEFVFELAK